MSAGEEMRLSDVLVQCADSLHGDFVALGTIASALGERSLAALLIVFALPLVIPAVGTALSFALGLPLAIISVQIMLGHRRAGLPGFLSRKTLAVKEVKHTLLRILPSVRRLERLAKPGSRPLTAWTTAATGATCLLLSILIFLPVPMGNVLPGAAISLLALGLLEHNRIALAAGFAAAAAGVAIIALAVLGVVMLMNNL
jgi:hypothetical protein